MISYVYLTPKVPHHLMAGAGACICACMGNVASLQGSDLEHTGIQGVQGVQGVKQTVGEVPPIHPFLPLVFHHLGCDALCMPSPAYWVLLEVVNS